MITQPPPGEQSPEDDTALLTTALNHYWAWYDSRYSRALQLFNFYLVAIAILLTAYTSAINGKHYGIAAALAVAGLAMTALTAAAVLVEGNSAASSTPGLTELQNRMADRLRIKPIRARPSRHRPKEHGSGGASPPSPSRWDWQLCSTSARCSTP